MKNKLFILVSQTLIAQLNDFHYFNIKNTFVHIVITAKNINIKLEKLLQSKEEIKKEKIFPCRLFCLCNKNGLSFCDREKKSTFSYT